VWWATELTPILALPCAIALAVIAGAGGAAPLFAMAVFLAIAVPPKIRQCRMYAARCTPKPDGYRVKRPALITA
jgi:hypothetical protein